MVTNGHGEGTVPTESGPLYPLSTGTPNVPSTSSLFNGNDRTPNVLVQWKVEDGGVTFSSPKLVSSVVKWRTDTMEKILDVKWFL